MRFHPSYLLSGASPFPLDVGYLIFGGIQLSPVKSCSAASCNFGVLAGELSAWPSTPPLWVMLLFFNMLSRLVITFLPESKCFFNLMATVTIWSGFRVQKSKKWNQSVYGFLMIGISWIWCDIGFFHINIGTTYTQVLQLYVYNVCVCVYIYIYIIYTYTHT